MKLLNSMILLAAFSVLGCAHGLMRGSVAMKTGNNEAHVCLGDNDVRVGDKVTAFNNHCPSKSGGRAGEGGGGICEKISIGGGTVTSLINHHYSVVKFDDGVKFSEGTIVEKR